MQYHATIHEQQIKIKICTIRNKSKSSNFSIYMLVYISSLAIIRALEILAHKIVLIIFRIIIKSSKIHLYLELDFEYLLVQYTYVCTSICRTYYIVYIVHMCNESCSFRIFEDLFVLWIIFLIICRVIQSIVHVIHKILYYYSTFEWDNISM